VAREVLIVDAQGLASPNLKKFEYHKVRRPIWPLDLD
jgi:microcystin degradation protein MlrC